MSFLNKIFQTIPVKIPDRSGFDLSHEVLSTAHVGTITPVTSFEVLPGDTISMGSLMKVTLPPFAVPFMGRVDACLEAFFVPYRVLWNGWQSFITQNNGTQPNSTYQAQINPNSQNMPGSANFQNVPYSVPRVKITAQANPVTDHHGNNTYLAGPGSLMDYLGIKFNTQSGYSGEVSAMKFLAYHKCCDDWYRDENNIKPFFPKVFQRRYLYADNNGNQLDLSTSSSSPATLPFDANGCNMTAVNGVINNPVVLNLDDTPLRFTSTSNIDYGIPVDMSLRLGALRQRCWAKDYFTTATTRPTSGPEASVMFNISGTTSSGSVTGSGSFTVSQLRQANSLSNWLIRNNIAGTEYGSILRAHFGVTPPDAVLNRSILLGSVRTPVYVGSVTNQAGNGTPQQTGSAENVVHNYGTSSPYGQVLGAAAGFGSAATDGRLIDDFTVKEHGCIMVMFTLVPHAYYASGLDREMLHLGVGDFAWPEFANVGDQAISQSEVVGSAGIGGTFGYNQRYSEYKFLKDRISGYLSMYPGWASNQSYANSGNLSVYALQRAFMNGSTVNLGAKFLEIPKDFLDQVLAASTTNLMHFGCMVDAYFDCQALRILPEYSLPSLCPITE